MSYISILRSMFLLPFMAIAVQMFAGNETYSSFIVNEVGYRILPDRDHQVAVTNRAEYPSVPQATSRSSEPRRITYIYVYRDLKYEGEVNIPTQVTYNGVTYTVKNIDERAFYNCKNLTAVSLPETLDSICKHAFLNCSKLERMVIPGSVSFISGGAFNGCTGIKYMRLSDGDGILEFKNDTNNGSSTFMYNSPLDTLYLGRNIIKDFERSPFRLVKNVIMTEGVTTLCDKEFYQCHNLTSVVFGKNVIKLGTSIFGSCNQLENVKAMSDGIKVIPERAFNGCSKLPTLPLPEQLDSIGPNAFTGCSSLNRLTIPKNTRAIAKLAFLSCESLSILTFEPGPDDLHFWSPTGNGQFADCQIDTLYLGRNIITEDNNGYSFYRTKNVVLNSNLTTLPDRLFNPNTTNSSIIKVYAPWKNPFTINENVFNNIAYKYATLVVPTGAVETYRATDGWSRFLNIEEEGSPNCSLRADNLTIEAGDEAELTVTLNNIGLQPTAYQFVLTLPSGFTLAKDASGSFCYTLSDRHDSNSHTLTIAEQDDGSYSVVCFSAQNSTLTDNSGPLFTLRVKADASQREQQQGFIRGTIVCDANGAKTYLDETMFNIDIVWPVITIDDATRLYGDDNPTFTYTLSGAPLRGEPQLLTTATAISPIGTYIITANKGTIENGHYEFVDGTLTIEQAPLTISAGDYTMTEGDELPIFSPHYEGFKNGEDETVLITPPLLSCEATSDSEPGEYVVNIGGADAQNYDIDYVYGILTVNERGGIQMGDVNIDGAVDVADVVQTVNHIIGHSPSPFYVRYADINRDGEVNTADLVNIVAIITGTYDNNAAARYQERVVENSAQITATLVGGNIQINLNTLIGYTAFQLSFVLPEGTTTDNLQLSEERRANHVVSTGQTDGRQTVVVYSPDNRLLEGNSGPLLTMQMPSLTNESIIIEGIIFVTPEGEIHRLDDLTLQNVSGIADINNTVIPLRRYALDGCIASGRGLNIVRYSDGSIKKTINQ